MCFFFFLLLTEVEEVNIGIYDMQSKIKNFQKAQKLILNVFFLFLSPNMVENVGLEVFN